MQKILLSLGVLLMTMVLPVKAAPSSRTTLWETMLIKRMGGMFCQAKAGKMLKAFGITEKQCWTTYKYAARQCARGVNAISFYNVQDRYTGETWGRIIGTCVGLSYDLKYRYKNPNIP